MIKIHTSIEATPKNLGILGSVLGQLSDGIWENSRGMQKYWKSLHIETAPDGKITVIDEYYACADPVEFLANKIKQVLKVEQEDYGEVRWERDCATVSRYLNHTPVTVGDAYKLYEQLKGRDTSKKYYASLSTYIVSFELSGFITDVEVEATNPYEAKSKAQKKFLAMAKVTANLK